MSRNDEGQASESQASDSPTKSGDILSDPRSLVDEFHRLVLEVNPSATFPSRRSAMDDDVKNASECISALRRMEALDEGVMRSWMRHAGTWNAEGKACFKVMDMLRSLNSFERNIPAPDVIRRRQAMAIRETT